MKVYMFAVVLPLLTSCATITRGVHEKLRVESDPPGANIQLSTGEKGVTPAKFVKNRRADSFTVTVSKPGWATQTVRVESKFSGTGGAAMVGGNFVLGGFVGVGVDAATGAYNSLYPNPVKVELAPISKEAKREAAQRKLRATPGPSPRPKPSPSPSRLHRPT